MRCFFAAVILIPILGGAVAAESVQERAAVVARQLRERPDQGPVRVIVEPTYFREKSVNLSSRRPVTQSIDARGIRTSFVSNQLVLTPRTHDELRSIVAQLGAEIVSSDAVPLPPASVRNPRRDVPTGPRSFVLRVTTDRYGRDDLTDLVRAAGGSGELQLSDDAGARLVAEVLRLRSRGISASLDIVLEPLFGRDKAVEMGGLDFFSEPAFRGSTEHGLSNVTRAWQLLFAAGISTPIVNAIIDDGFWLINRIPGDIAGIIDLGAVNQFDFIEGDFDAGGANPKGRFHGYGIAGLIAGLANNSTGVAGVSGFTASTPLLLRVELASEAASAIRMAAAVGADVINISMGAACNTWCEIGNLFPVFGGDDKIQLVEAVSDADRAGAVVVSAAGNTGENVDDVTMLPCIFVTICVGAVDVSGSTRLRAKVSGDDIVSGYGSSVHLFAPGRARVMVGGSSTPAVAQAAGTSVSAALVSGTVAMMRSANATASPAQITSLLLDSAWNQNPSGPGDHVGKWLNSYAAVLASLGGRIRDDLDEAGDDPNQPSSLSLAPNGAGGLVAIKRQLTLRNHLDRDTYRLTLPDYRSLRVRLHHMQTLNSTTLEVRSHSALDPEPFEESRQPDLKEQVSVLVPPGQHDIIVSGSGPQLYDLEVEASPATLPRDRFDIPFSSTTFLSSISNDTPSAPGAINSRERLTLHVPGDVDWLSFVGPPLRNARVLVWSELPIDVALYQEGQLANPLQSQDSVTTFKAGIGATVRYMMRIKGTQATRYVVSVTGDPLVVGERQVFPWFDLGDPPDLLEGIRETYRIAVRPEQLVSDMPGVTFTFEPDGNSGDRLSSVPNVEGRQVLDLSRLSQARTGILTLQRDAAVVDGPIPFRLSTGR
jgi:hypothetical protein